MANVIVDVGMRFGRLVVTKRFNDQNRQQCDVACDCGALSRVRRGNLASGRTQSCGCMGFEKRVTRFRKHGECKTLMYRLWQHMRYRCSSSEDAAYQYYGGRGIRVCERWEQSYEVFRDDMGPRPSPQHSIDRINVNGNYEPENVRWATRTQQSRNTRRNVFIETPLGRMCLSEAAGRYGVLVQTLWLRLKKGETVHAALRPSPRIRLPRIE